MYLAAIIDWYSRYVLAWRLSNTLDGSCTACLRSMGGMVCSLCDSFHARAGANLASIVCHGRHLLFAPCLPLPADLGRFLWTPAHY